MAEPADAERPSKRIRLEENGQDKSAEEDDQLRRELRAGITHYVNPDTPGFNGILKQRYTDFLVNEIELNGQVLHLTNTAVPVRITNNKSAGKEKPKDEEPSLPAEAETASVGNSIATEEKTAEVASRNGDTGLKDDSEAWRNDRKIPAYIDSLQVSEANREHLEELFGEPCVVAIIKLYREVLKHPDRKPKEFRSISTWSIDDKSRRGTAHQAIRSIFKNHLTSTHAEKNELVITKTARGGRGLDGGKWSRNDAGSAGGGKGKMGWDELGGEYLHFTLHKENKDTMEVISFLGTQMKCAPKNFAFAGTKDRRAVTVQRVSVFRQQAWQLAGLNKILRHGSKVGDFKYEQRPLELGALWGNEFVITLRDCHFVGEEAQWTFHEQLALAKKTVGDAVTNLQQNGFLNYYGLQRFGSFSAGTDDIGKKLLQGDFEAAVAMILDFHASALEAAKDENTTAKISSDDRNRALALDIWRRTGDSQKAIDKVPRKFSTETAIIRYLGMERRGQRVRDRDFQGAMQSIQRNMRLMYVHAYQSLVWNTVAGKRWELYGPKIVEGDLIIIGDKSDGTHEAEPEVDEDGEPIIRPSAEDSAATDGDFTRARPLSKAEAESGKYDIFDVVLPLPGWDVKYPPNTIGAFYKDFMGSEAGGHLDPHDMRRKWKDYSLSGGYRKLVARPAPGMSFEVRGYNEETEQLVQTDLEILEKGSTGDNQNGMASEQEGDKFIATILRMKLGASQYATMALREMLKAGGLRNFQADFTGRGY